MNAVDYLKVKGRMTEDCTISCSKCPIDKNNNSKDIDCMRFESECAEQAVAIVEQWAKENPVKTYLSVLLERLPNINLKDSKEPFGCPSRYFKASDVLNCVEVRCLDCWNREYKEGE